MPRNIYVQLDYHQGKIAREHVLSSEIDALNMAKKLHEYKKLRKQEFILKTRLKTLFKQLGSEVGKIIKEMPDEEFHITPSAKTSKVPGIKSGKKETSREKRKSKSIEKELEDIQEKLSKLKA